MHRDRVILHCDMNSYFVSVELLKHPELKALPVAVSGILRIDTESSLQRMKSQKSMA